ncbi:MAG: M1 family metallopeptidase, partial [Bacteroidia bacterium]|nr:M1 family metallopeptidase [Bacteroidia bacterium]
SSQAWFPTIDSPNERTTQEIFITVEDKYTTLSNGKLISSTKNPDGTRTDHWKMSLGHAPYLFMMAIGEFAVVKDKWRNIEVNYYVEKEYEKYAKMIFGNTPEMLEFFSKKLGVMYPWEKYSQVVVRDFVSGAMENTTATIHFSALQHDDREHLDETHEDIIAHELFHHWFGDLVTCESWANLPLNESFATYGEYLWNEYKYGKEEADKHLDSDLQQYMAEAQQKREPLIRYYYLRREDMFDGHSYQKGGRVLHMLRNVVGDDAFFAALKLYLERNQFSDVEIAELRIAFEDVTGKDLMWFFDQWFMKPGHPELSISQEYISGSLKLNIRQTQDLRYMPVYRIPTKIGITTSSGTKHYPIEFWTKDTTITFALDSEPLNVDFDSDKILLAKINHEKPRNMWLNQLKTATHYKAKQLAINKLKPDLDNPEIKAAIMQLLDDPFWAIRVDAINALKTVTSITDQPILTKLKQLVETDKKARVRSEAIDLLTELLPPVGEGGAEGEAYRTFLKPI